METMKMNAVDKIALVDEHLANAMRLAAGLRVEMDIVTDGVCINKDGIMIIDQEEYNDACDKLDGIILLIGRLTGALMAEAVFDDVKKLIDINGEKLTEAQKKRLSRG